MDNGMYDGISAEEIIIHQYKARSHISNFCKIRYESVELEASAISS